MKRWWLALVVMVVTVEVEMVVFPCAVAQGLSPSQCNAQKNNIENSCRNVALLRGQPTAACCQLLKTANVECVCQFVTPKLVAVIGGADRAIKLISNCGRTIPRNFKCGSVTTPP